MRSDDLSVKSHVTFLANIVSGTGVIASCTEVNGSGTGVIASCTEVNGSGTGVIASCIGVIASCTEVNDWY